MSDQTARPGDARALEQVNIEGRRLDVFVRRTDGRIAQLMMVAIQDVHSRKILDWRIVDGAADA